MMEAKAGGTPETTSSHQKLEAAGRIPLQRSQREHSPAHPSNSEFGLQNYARVSSTPQMEVCERTQGLPTEGHVGPGTGRPGLRLSTSFRTTPEPRHCFNLYL